MEGIVYIAQNRYYADPEGRSEVFKLGYTKGTTWEDVEDRWKNQGPKAATNYPSEVRPVFAVRVDDMESVEREMHELLVGAQILGGGKEWFCGSVERTKSALLRFPNAQEVERSEEAIEIEKAQKTVAPVGFAGWTLAEVGIGPEDTLKCVKSDCPAYLEGAKQEGNKPTFILRWEGHERDGERMSIYSAATAIDGYPASGPGRFRAPERLQSKPTETLDALIRRIREEADAKAE